MTAKIKWCAALLALAMLCVILCLPVAATEGGVRVYDPSGMLTAEETSALAQRMETLSAESGVELYLATYVAQNYRDDFIGDEYCRDIRNLRGEDAVLLIVTYDLSDQMFYYDMYTYGEANYAISQKEVDYILDRREVYNNIKSGYVAAGVEAFFDLSAQAFEGRVGASWASVITVSALISVVIALIVCAGVVASYKKRRATVDYPLDRYAKLSLTKESDAFVREYTTRTRVSSSSSGGGSGGRHGGGGGHRGGR
jgi:uncharacterized membrane protein YgcG